MNNNITNEQQQNKLMNNSMGKTKLMLNNKTN